MAKYDYDMIVIGGGAAGLTASTFAGQSAAKTLLIEKEEKLGGDCLHFGCVPSKSLIKSAYVYNVMKKSEKYGLPKVDVPAVDYKQVTGRINRIIDTIQEHDEPEYLEKEYNVETQFGEAKFLDAHTIELNGQKITGRYFVLAMGSAPFIPPIEGLDQVDYITNMQIFSLEKLPESMIVLGGGPIGMEMAQAFARFGCKVSVVQSQSHILAREDEDISVFMEEIFLKEEIDLLLKSKAVKVEKKDEKIEVMVEKNGQTSIISAEALLVATGRQPNVEGLDLEKAGVEFDSRGIKVDGKLRTATKHIYACGDINGKLPFTHVAAYESVQAISHCLLKLPVKVDYTNAPWCTYLDPEIASIGYNETRAKEAGLDYHVHKESIDHNDRALAEGENHGFIKILFDKKDKVIGVQIVGFHAGDLIAEWIPVLNGNRKLSAITNAIHPYPTMAELNKNSAVNHYVSTIPAWPKKIMKFLFGYQGKV